MKGSIWGFVALLAIVSDLAVAEENCVDKQWITTPKWRVLVENDILAGDSLTGLNEDRNYTMGVIVSTYGPFARDSDE